MIKWSVSYTLPGCGSRVFERCIEAPTDKEAEKQILDKYSDANVIEIVEV